jgi:hypothetical protein
VKLLLAGWFSFESGHATAGDVISRDVVAGWLDARGWRYDVAAAPPFDGDLHWRRAKPDGYDAVLFVCGPFGDGELERGFLERFAARPVYGLNLSLLESLERWNPFRRLWERDSDRTARPDLAFLRDEPLVPVIGVCKVEPYPEGRTDLTDPAIDALLAGREAAVVPVDTRLDVNSTGLRSAAEVESLIARLDAVVTTRLHGTVLALKHGVPVLPIDPEPGGFKIRRQVETVGWDVCFDADRLEPAALEQALDHCLTSEARARAEACAARARRLLAGVEAEVAEELARL